MILLDTLLVSSGRLDALMPPGELRASLLASADVLGATLMTADDRLLKWKHPVERHNARG